MHRDVLTRAAGVKMLPGHMTTRHSGLRGLFFVTAIAATSCAYGAAEHVSEVDVKPRGVTPSIVTSLGDNQATGVAIAHSGRAFVSFPRWSHDIGPSVAELGDNGSLAPFPSVEWNDWSEDDVANAAQHFVCVQAIWVDGDDHLWILDPASPRFEGVVPGGAKLVEVDLGSNRVLRSIAFSNDIAPASSYLNDVRVDTKQHTAYITDSGLGGIIVVDLTNERPRRVLADHPSTKAELITPVVNGAPLQRTDGHVPQVHSDGIALDRDGTYLYFHALTGRSVYRVATQDLRDVSLPADMLGARVTHLATTAAADGMEIDTSGRLLVTDIEHSAIVALDVRGATPVPVVVAQSPLLDWPDSIAIAPDGSILVTASQIERMPIYRGFAARNEPYRLLRIELRDRHPAMSQR